MKNFFKKILLIVCTISLIVNNLSIYVYAKANKMPIKTINLKGIKVNKSKLPNSYEEINSQRFMDDNKTGYTLATKNNGVQVLLESTQIKKEIPFESEIRKRLNMNEEYSLDHIFPFDSSKNKIYYLCSFVSKKDNKKSQDIVVEIDRKGNLKVNNTLPKPKIKSKATTIRVVNGQYVYFDFLMEYQGTKGYYYTSKDLKKWTKRVTPESEGGWSIEYTSSDKLILVQLKNEMNNGYKLKTKNRFYSTKDFKTYKRIAKGIPITSNKGNNNRIQTSLGSTYKKDLYEYEVTTYNKDYEFSKYTLYESKDKQGKQFKKLFQYDSNKYESPTKYIYNYSTIIWAIRNDNESSFFVRDNKGKNYKEYIVNYDLLNYKIALVNTKEKILYMKNKDGIVIFKNGKFYLLDVPINGIKYFTKVGNKFRIYTSDFYYDIDSNQLEKKLK